jgi:ABC-type uncharacterized transport system permease subunit
VDREQIYSLVNNIIALNLVLFAVYGLMRIYKGRLTKRAIIFIFVAVLGSANLFFATRAEMPEFIAGLSIEILGALITVYILQVVTQQHPRKRPNFRKQFSHMKAQRIKLFHGKRN